MGDKDIAILESKELGKSLKEDLAILDLPGLKQEIEKQIKKAARTSGEKVAAGKLAKDAVMAACGEAVLRYHPELEEYSENQSRGGRGYDRLSFNKIALETGRRNVTLSRWIDKRKKIKSAGGFADYFAQEMPGIIERWEAALLREEYVDAGPLPDDKYRIIYADPPWMYATPQHSKEEQATVLGTHYPSMPAKKICELKVKELAWDHSVLFLWNTVPLIHDALRVMKAWGFTYKSEMIWDKIKHNVGYWLSVRHERLWICSRGSCLPDNKKLYDSVQSIERTEHSAKPAFFREMIDDLYPPPADYKKKRDRIELFPRGELPKHWDGWGNEYGI